MSTDAEIRAALISALDWQVELGADEAIAEHPVDRFAATAPQAQPDAPTKPSAQIMTAAAGVQSVDAGHGPKAGDPAKRAMQRDVSTAPPPPPESPAPESATLAAQAQTLEDLAEKLQAWDGSPLKETARNFVFCDGLPGAHLIVVGEAPGQEEDRQGKPFVGRAGQLLDRMLAAIGLDRTSDDPARAAYITNILPWRPAGNRTPTPDEAAQFLPFVIRHIQLAQPKIILAMGNTPTKALLQTTTGIKRMRGQWVDHTVTGLPLLPSFHPAYLLRQPADKKLAWHDLIAVRRALDGENPT
ncbi:MAG: uracil-DNA glycosylase [Pseudomonadota bacterium]